jgi:protein-S-isoprenylcysteine O-methyltransferase Ste14
MQDRHERPNVFPWPPVLFVSALLAANLAVALGPASLTGAGVPRDAIAQSVGWMLVIGALGFMLWAFLAFRHHRTTILPHRGADSLITAGPFAVSRNPIYLAEAVLLAGLALVNGAIWYLVVIPPFMLAVTRLAIVREEAHLEARFGAAWRDYAARVRRWI